jgi:diaminopimelate decarboxylase
MSAGPNEPPRRPHIAWTGGELHVEHVRAGRLARQYGTPLFVYSKAAMLAALAPTSAASPAATRQDLLRDEGQLVAGRAAGVRARRLRLRHRLRRRAGTRAGRRRQAGDIIFSGVGKTRAEMRRALEAGIGCFNVESEAELEVLSEVAAVHGPHGAGEHARQSRTSIRRRIPTSPPA